jgi:hypothetical protein
MTALCRGSAVQKADDRLVGLLRPSRERPRRSRAAERD